LADFTRFELLLVHIHSRAFDLSDSTKKGRYKVTERLYFTRLSGIPSWT